MQKKGANISLSSYDDIFETDESRADSQLERVQKIPLRSLVPLKNHPFKVVDDEAMLRTTESIAQFGVLTPLIARPLEAQIGSQGQMALAGIILTLGVWIFRPFGLSFSAGAFFFALRSAKSFSKSALAFPLL